LFSLKTDHIHIKIPNFSPEIKSIIASMTIDIRPKIYISIDYQKLILVNFFLIAY
jgi:hypothetical protein